MEETPLLESHTLLRHVKSSEVDPFLHLAGQGPIDKEEGGTQSGPSSARHARHETSTASLA